MPTTSEKQQEATTQPLWDDERISNRVFDTIDVWDKGLRMDEVEWMMKLMRDDYEAELASLRAENKQLQISVARWRTGYTQVVTERDGEREKWITAEAELDSLRQQLAKLQEELDDNDVRVNSYHTQFVLQRAVVEAADQEIAQLEQQLAEAQRWEIVELPEVSIITMRSWDGHKLLSVLEKNSDRWTQQDWPEGWQLMCRRTQGGEGR